MFCECILIYLSFYDSSLNVYDNFSLGRSYHCHCKVNGIQ